MESNRAGQLTGKEIHGFRTLQDLDIPSILEEAKMRWLRPNEIHAILCNYKYFNIFVKPVNLPTSGTIVLFDRKMLRNFRKDGHNWKKKKDGKTVKEAHEHLKLYFCLSCSVQLFFCLCTHKGRGKVGVHPTLPRPHLLDYTGLVMTNGFMYTMHTEKIFRPLFGDVTGYLTSLWNT